MLQSVQFNKNFQTWLLIGWQLCYQPIRCHVRKSLLTNMDFDMDFLKSDPISRLRSHRIFEVQFPRAHQMLRACRPDFRVLLSLIITRWIFSNSKATPSGHTWGQAVVCLLRVPILVYALYCRYRAVCSTVLYIRPRDIETRTKPVCRLTPFNVGDYTANLVHRGRHSCPKLYRGPRWCLGHRR